MRTKNLENLWRELLRSRPTEDDIAYIMKHVAPLRKAATEELIKRTENSSVIAYYRGLVFKYGDNTLAYQIAESLIRRGHENIYYFGWILVDIIQRLGELRDEAWQIMLEKVIPRHSEFAGYVVSERGPIRRKIGLELRKLHDSNRPLPDNNILYLLEERRWATPRQLGKTPEEILERGGASLDQESLLLIFEYIEELRERAWRMFIEHHENQTYGLGPQLRAMLENEKGYSEVVIKRIKLELKKRRRGNKINLSRR